MAGLVIPRNLQTAAADNGAPEFRDWVAALPQNIDALADQWSLTVGEPFQPGGACAWVAPVSDSSGRDLVLKVGWQHSEALHEPDGLRFWRGDGAVRLHVSEEFRQTTALLLERCQPGTPLNQELPDEEQDEVVADLLKRLWRQPTGTHPFRTLSLMCNQWADEFEEGLTHTTNQLDPGLTRTGIGLFRSLAEPADSDVLLCTDLHAGNILAAEREPWLMIDPKPYVGDPTYDALQHLLNCRERLTTDPVGLARRLADLLQLDPDRLVLWLFARCVQESMNSAELGQLARHLAPD